MMQCLPSSLGIKAKALHPHCLPDLIYCYPSPCSLQSSHAGHMLSFQQSEWTSLQDLAFLFSLHGILFPDTLAHVLIPCTSFHWCLEQLLQIPWLETRALLSPGFVDQKSRYSMAQLGHGSESHKAKIKMSVGLDSFLEALGISLLPGSLGCWLDSVSCSCRTEVLFPCWVPVRGWSLLHLLSLCPFPCFSIGMLSLPRISISLSGTTILLLKAH